MAEQESLAALVAHLRQQAGERETALAGIGLAAGDYPRLAAVDDFRRLWSQLHARRQLRAALAPPPADAGPLNSTSLAQRALALMHEASPGYLEHFMAWLDALAWLERMQAEGGLGPSQTTARRPARTAGKTSRGRKRRG